MFSLVEHASLESFLSAAVMAYTNAATKVGVSHIKFTG